MPRSSGRTSRHVPLAKLTPPRLPVVLERRRLYRRLDQARKRPIVWITAPPGSGKTTLVAGYLRARRLRPLWYNVDERDGDLATFFHYLSLAAKQAAPRFRRPLPHLTPEYLLGLPTFTRNFFESLASRLAPRTILVFDNYHEVPADAPVHDLLPVGLRELPEGMAALIVSRQPPPSAFAGLEATQTLAVIEPEALRLTERECGGIIRLHAARERGTLPKTLREELHGRVQGWVAGLILVLGQVKAGERDAALARDQQPEVLFEYLASQALGGLPSETHTFLLKTAHLPVMTVAMAEQLTGLPTAGEMLSKLYRARYFTERRNEAQPWYQYHPLFREFLLARSKTTLPADELKSLQRTAATLLADAGRTEDAMQLWQKAGETDELIALILAQAPPLLAQGRAQTLESWLRDLPPESLEHNPWLLFWLGSCRFAFNPKESRDLFAQAFERFATLQDRSGLWLAWCGVVEAIVYSFDFANVLDEWLEKARFLLEKDPALPSEEIKTRVACAMFSAMIWVRPHDPLFGAWEAKVVSRLPMILDPNQRAKVMFDVALHRMWTGRLSGAWALADRLRADLRAAGEPPLGMITHSLLEAGLSWHSSYDRCMAAVTRGLELARTTGVLVLSAWLPGQMVYTMLQSGDLDGAGALLNEMRPAFEFRQEVYSAFYHYLKGWLFYLKGDMDKAWEDVDIALGVCTRNGVAVNEHLTRLARAQLLYARGDEQDAQRQLKQAYRFVVDAKATIVEFIARLIQAEAALHRGDEVEGLEALRVGMRIGATTGLMYTPWWRPPSGARLCARALDAGIEVEYVTNLIQALKLVPDDLSAACPAWPWPVKVTTLGRFSLAVDGQSVTFGRKTPRRPLTLLRAMIALGGQDVSEAQLADVLWPEAEGDAAAEALAVNVRRLRKLLHHPSAIQQGGGKITLNPQVCWVDVRAFDALLAEAEQESKAGHRDAALRLSERAVTLYGGSFLSREAEEPWTERLRDRLRQKYTGFVRRLALHWEEDGQHDRATAVLEKAIEIEPLVESFYQHLRTALERQGRQAEAQAVYVRCRKTLNTLPQA